MQYQSTRGQAPHAGFDDILLAGLAGDGGLFVPAEWPSVTADQITSFARQPFAEVAARVIHPFVGDSLSTGELTDACAAAYSGFGHTAVAPLVQLGPNRWLLELFHGPTLAFKDVAMQLLARLMDVVLTRRGDRITIVGATSGDTGAAAIEAFAGSAAADVFIMFPAGRISPIQQRQMTTSHAGNVHAIAIDGTFDDCQALLKAMFGHEAFRHDVALAGVNSINWARILGQVTYYFTAAAALGSPHREVSFTVPTGNFGDIYAGYVAKRMGLPVDRLVIASNVNDILTRTLDGGRYEVRNVVPTTSPSMDIQVSSNFERLLFEAGGRDAVTVRGMMASLSQSGAFGVDATTLAAIRDDFDAGMAHEAEASETIAATRASTGLLIDPHTAVGLSVANRLATTDTPMVTLATAHPAKFPEAVEDATGATPKLPPRLQHLLDGDEAFTTLPNDRPAVEAFIRATSRAVRHGAGV